MGTRVYHMTRAAVTLREGNLLLCYGGVERRWRNLERIG